MSQNDIQDGLIRPAASHRTIVVQNEVGLKSLREVHPFLNGWLRAILLFP